MPRRSEDKSTEIIRRFRAHLEQLRRRPNTIDSYSADVNAFIEWLQKNRMWPLEPDSRAPQKYRDELLKSSRPATTNRKLSSIRAFLKWAVKIGLYTASADADLISVRLSSRRSVEWLTPPEQIRLFGTVRAKGTDPEVAIVGLFLYAGLRMSELINLTWGSLHTEKHGGGNLHVKIANTEYPRDVLLHDAVGHALVRLGFSERNESAFVFEEDSEPLTRRVVQGVVSRWARASGVKASPRILRSTFCRNLVDAHLSPTAIAQLAGYRSADATFRYFDDPDPKLTEMLLLRGPQPSGLDLESDTWADFLFPDPSLIDGVVGHEVKSIRSGVWRDESVRRRVLRRADGRCERCGNTWRNPLFLEVHHLLSVTEKEDTYENCVALCPNCHREIHLHTKPQPIEAGLLAVARSFTRDHLETITWMHYDSHRRELVVEYSPLMPFHLYFGVTPSEYDRLMSSTSKLDFIEGTFMRGTTHRHVILDRDTPAEYGPVIRALRDQSFRSKTSGRRPKQRKG